MNFNAHFNLVGKHAFLSASKYNWINDDEESLINRYKNYRAAERGTELHDFARHAIELGIKLPNNKKTLNRYVNDAIGFQMTPEQPLYYSENCFGTADTISFSKNFLRIHDLKTGVTPAHMEQLMIYEALFCLEYEYSPTEIEAELRIYQMDDIQIANPDPKVIRTIMDRIIFFDRVLTKQKEEEK